MPKSFQHIESFKVRDYECDLQGIVNNAVYQNYLEHARHEFLLSKGADFAALSEQGLDLVVTRAEVDYRKSLTSGDAFYAGTNFSMHDRIRFRFDQSIIRGKDGELCVKAVVFGTGITSSGRPKLPKDLINLLLAEQ